MGGGTPSRGQEEDHWHFYFISFFAIKFAMLKSHPVILMQCDATVRDTNALHWHPGTGDQEQSRPL